MRVLFPTRNAPVHCALCVGEVKFINIHVHAVNAESSIRIVL